MKKKILIYTIFRNSSPNIENYYSQMKSLIQELMVSFDVYLSLYENDSIDGTRELLEVLDFSFASGFSLITENLGTQRFKKSVADETRVKNLAAARNKALSAKNFINDADYVLCIESDICYTNKCVTDLINFQSDNNLTNVDIVSAVSLQGNGTLYDTWATRRTPTEEWGDLFSNRENKKYDRYYSTFNCICLYNASVMRKGGLYDWYNDRLQKFDCDTAVICETFHKLGHSDIFINYSSVCNHLKRKKEK